MENQTIDQFLEYYDIEIDYSFLTEILNNEEPQEIENQPHDQYNFDSNSNITELDLNVQPKIDPNGRWVRRRKFKKGTIEYALWKQEIKLKNRISARRSIEKKEAHIRELQGRIQRLHAENEYRRRVLQFIPNSKPAGRFCRLRRALSTSDFSVIDQDLATDKDMQSYCEIDVEMGRQISVEELADNIDLGLHTSPHQSFALMNTTFEATSWKKRKKSSVDDEEMVRALNKMAATLSQGLQSFGSCIDYMACGSELDARREALYEELMKVEGLTPMERDTAYVKMVVDESMLIAFASIPDEVKVEVIRQLIR